MPTSNKLSVKSKLAVGGIAALLGLVLGATIFGPVTAGAQETTTTTGPEAPADSAERKALQTERIRTALADLVENGTITAEQADAVAAHLAASWDFPGRRFHRIHAGLDVVAATIGITEADLVEALRNGDTASEVAEANGVDTQTVIDAIVAEVNARVDEAVAAGNLDQERATEIKANAEEKATAFVNGELSFRGHRGGDAGA